MRQFIVIMITIACIAEAQRLMPFQTVIETSIGVDRMFLSIMSAAYCEEQLENGESRVVLKLPAALAPVKLAVMRCYIHLQ